MLDWPYSETVPGGEPQPAEDQAYRYRDIASDLADAMMTAEQKSTDDAGELDCCARDYGDGPLLAVTSHPSRQFLHGWLLLKAGRGSELAAALRCFTAAAAHPLLRSSCLLLRGLCLLYLNKLDAAQQALTAGLELDALTGLIAGKAEPSLLIEAHSALAVIAALKAQTYSSNTSSSEDESSSKLAALQLTDDLHAGATDPRDSAPVSEPLLGQEGTATAPAPDSMPTPAAPAMQAAPGSSPTHLPAETSVAATGTATASEGMPGLSLSCCSKLFTASGLQSRLHRLLEKTCLPSRWRTGSSPLKLRLQLAAVPARPCQARAVALHGCACLRP